MSRQRGFTLIEVLLSVGILSLIVGISLPISASFVQRNDLDTTTESVAVALRRAETYARSMQNDNAWSVEIQSAAATLFQGTNFGARDTTLDETVDFPGSVTASGLGEVQFAEFTGIPNTTGTITLTSTTGDTRTITINAKGVVTY